MNCRNERSWQLVQDTAADDVDHDLGLVSLKQVGQLAVIFTLQIVDCFEDGGEVSGKQLTYTSCCFDLAEEHLAVKESLKGSPPPGRYVRSPDQIVVENSLFTEINELKNIGTKSLPIINLL